MKLTITGSAGEIRDWQGVHRIDLAGIQDKNSGLLNLERSFMPEQVEFVVEEPKRWRAEERGYFYYIDAYTHVSCRPDNHGEFTTDLYRLGNYFRTRTEAEAAAEEIRAMLRGEER